MSDNNVPKFILSFSGWREGDGPFAPHPIFPDGFAWSRDAKSKEWVMSDGKGSIITKTMWLKATNQGVVSEFTSIEDAQPAPHIFDRIADWPQAHRQCLGTKDLPEGWEWEWFGDDWVLSNGTISLTRKDWFKHHDIKLATDHPEFHLGDDETKTVTASSMLQSALGHMEDRAKTYDAPGGERSMGKTVSAFNTITGLELTEEQGWLFMEILKQVRSQQGNYRADNYEDMVAYAALRGECAARERGDK